MKRLVGLALAWVLLFVVLFYTTFILGFYLTFRGPEGYSCQPTITFGYKCTGPNGEVFSNR